MRHLNHLIKNCAITWVLMSAPCFARSECSNLEKIAARVEAFLSNSAQATHYERLENVFALRQGGRPVKPLSQFPVFVERKGGKVKRIFQVDPTHPSEVEVFNLDGKHIDVQDFTGNSLVASGKKSLQNSRNFWKQ